jgi:Tfp pilus assembly protein PilF
MADLAARATLPNSRLLAWTQAVEAGKRAASAAEDRANACYSLAALLAAQNDSAGAEQSLRNAIAAAPNWYKPHWTLARLLSLAGRNEEALAEARAAVDLGGGRHAEVFDTLTELKQRNAQNR